MNKKRLQGLYRNVSMSLSEEDIKRNILLNYSKKSRTTVKRDNIPMPLYAAELEKKILWKYSILNTFIEP